MCLINYYKLTQVNDRRGLGVGCGEIVGKSGQEKTVKELLPICLM